MGGAVVREEERERGWVLTGYCEKGKRAWMARFLKVRLCCFQKFEMLVGRRGGDHC